MHYGKGDNKVKYKYKVYDGDRFIGEFKSEREIARRFHIDKSTLNYHLRGDCMICGTYRVDKEKVEKNQKKTKEELDMEFLTSHLKKYGNVGIVKRQLKYVDELEKQGYKVVVIENISYKYDDSMLTPKKRGKVDKSYSLQLA